MWGAAPIGRAPSSWVRRRPPGPGRCARIWGGRDYPTLLGAAARGLGLAQAPHPLARAAIEDGKLEPLLTDVAAATPGVFLYYPDRRQVLPKLRAFIDHIRSATP